MLHCPVLNRGTFSLPFRYWDTRYKSQCCDIGGSSRRCCWRWRLLGRDSVWSGTYLQTLRWIVCYLSLQCKAAPKQTQTNKYEYSFMDSFTKMKLLLRSLKRRGNITTKREFLYCSIILYTWVRASWIEFPTQQRERTVADPVNQYQKL